MTETGPRGRFLFSAVTYFHHLAPKYHAGHAAPKEPRTAWPHIRIITKPT